MADITLPPVQIGPISGAAGQVECLGDFSAGLISEGSFGGPFLIGGANYMLQIQRVGSPQKIRVYESVAGDKGANWAEQDAANAPVFDSSGGPLVMNATLALGKIWVGYFTERPVTAGLQFSTFEPGVGWTHNVFPAILADLRENVLGDKQQSHFALGIRSDGSAVLVYENVDGGGNWNMVYRINTGGVWGSPTTIATNGGVFPAITLPTWTFPKLVIDASNNALCFMVNIDANLPGPSNGETFYFFKIDAVDILTAAVAIETTRPSVSAGTGSCASQPRIFNGDLLLPAALADGSLPGIPVSMVLYTGSPAAAPVFGPKTIFEAGFPTFLSIGQPAAVLFEEPSAGRIYFAWIYQPEDNSACEIRRSINGGSGWGATGVFYDLRTNPPNATPDADQFISVLSGGEVGSVGAAIGVLDPVLEDGIGFFLVPDAGPGPPVPVPIFGPVTLDGGEASVPYILNGCLLGIKRFKEC